MCSSKIADFRIFYRTFFRLDPGHFCPTQTTLQHFIWFKGDLERMSTHRCAVVTKGDIPLTAVLWFCLLVTLSLIVYNPV